MAKLIWAWDRHDWVEMTELINHYRGSPQVQQALTNAEWQEWRESGYHLAETILLRAIRLHNSIVGPY